MTSTNFNKWLEHPSYLEAKEVLFNEVNRVQLPYKHNGGYVAPISATPSSNRCIFIDKSVFKKSPAEKQLIKEMRKELGMKWKPVTVAHFTT